VAPRLPPPSLTAGGILLGVGFTGYLDLIVFHQLLQWHHLASARVDDLGENVAIDGAFHILMFVALVAGVALLHRAARGDGAAPGRTIIGLALIGGGVFHLLDSIVNHWIIGLHRTNPHEATMFWDIVIFVSGLFLIALGMFLAREARDHAQPTGKASRR
jgi:uncharacterized membrane protein